MPRIFLSGLFHETNTFVEQPTPKSKFRIRRDHELLATRGDASPMAAFLETADLFDWEILPGVDYRASPSGTVEADLFEMFWSELHHRLTSELERGIDGIFLLLHGAMVAASHRDVEGELLARLRAIPAIANVPIVAVLDLHANVSERMARFATALIPYRKNPHTDAFETSVRATHALARCLRAPGSIRTHLRHSRRLLAPPDTGTQGPIMQPLETLARELQESSDHLEVGVAAGFSHADTPDAGLTFWVVSEQREDVCQRDLERLATAAEQTKTVHSAKSLDVSAALAEISRDPKLPALLVEPADNIGGGAPGDGTTLLRALIEHPIHQCGIVLSDPQAVLELDSISVGETIELALGGKNFKLDPGPLGLSVTLLSRSDGNFELEDKHSHHASMGGTHVAMGRCAVVRHKHITILLTSRPTPPFDLGQWRSQDIDPETFGIITIKAAVAHRQAYDPIIGSSFTVSTPGPCSSDLASLPYRHIRRPIHPLDPVV